MIRGRSKSFREKGGVNVKIRGRSKAKEKREE